MPRFTYPNPYPQAQTYSSSNPKKKANSRSHAAKSTVVIVGHNFIISMEPGPTY